MKYAADFVLALCALILLAPLFAAVAIAVKAEDGGKVFIKQSRTGQYGNSFFCYKFRSMKSGNVAFDKHSPVIKGDNPNLTKVGRVIRRLKIDELPQLINILKGEMCFIGPRPLLHDYDDEYETWELVKFEARPGLTGLAQVHGNGYLTIKARKYYDACYAMNASPAMDLAIIFRTIALLFIGERRLLTRVTKDDYERAEARSRGARLSRQTCLNFGVVPSGRAGRSKKPTVKTA